MFNWGAAVILVPCGYILSGNYTDPMGIMISRHVPCLFQYVVGYVTHKCMLWCEQLDFSYTICRENLHSVPLKLLHILFPMPETVFESFFSSLFEVCPEQTDHKKK